MILLEKVGKSRTNVTNVTMHPLMQAILGNFENTQWRQVKQVQHV